jgi:hypothetical protein
MKRTILKVNINAQLLKNGELHVLPLKNQKITNT